MNRCKVAQAARTGRKLKRGVREEESINEARMLRTPGRRRDGDKLGSERSRKERSDGRKRGGCMFNAKKELVQGLNKTGRPE